MRSPLRCAVLLWRTMNRVVFSLIPFLCLVTNACDSLPRDPQKTSEHVQQQHTVRIGLTEAPPWVIRNGAEPAGVEVELLQRFANSLGATPRWFWGGEQTRMEALERFELDVVIADLEAKTPWSKQVGLTRPYFDEEFAVGVSSGVQMPRTLRGLEVAVPEGDAVAAYVEKGDGIPVRTTNIFETSGPVAAPVWKLENRGLARTKFFLFKRQHVMAVPPGENGWLKKLGSYLEEQRPNLSALLKGQAQQ
jgi:polar amino acid transport system substrate-binding protein